MDLVHKQQRALSHAAAHIRLSHDLFDFFNAAGHRAEIHKFCLGVTGDDPCQSGFAHPGRSPEDHGRYLIPLDELTKYLARPQQMSLTHKFIQRLRSKPTSQRGYSHPLLKQIHLIHYRLNRSLMI